MRADRRGGLPEGRLRDRRTSGGAGMVAVEGAAGRSAGRVSAERISREDHGRASGGESGGGDELRLIMPRYAFQLRIKAGAVEEYEREHTRVWGAAGEAEGSRHLGLLDLPARAGIGAVPARRQFRSGLGHAGPRSGESSLAG